MSCDRCYDIHKAQKAGLNDNECKCSCHDDNISLCTCSVWATSTDCTEHSFTINAAVCDNTGSCSVLNINNS